nr:hypothetical protein [Escherichia coli]
MISLSPPTICNSADRTPEVSDRKTAPYDVRHPF